MRIFNQPQDSNGNTLCSEDVERLQAQGKITNQFIPPIKFEPEYKNPDAWISESIYYKGGL